MRLFLDCTHGSTKETFASALVALLPDPQAYMAEFAALELPGCTSELLVAQDAGRIGVHLAIAHEGDAGHHGHHHHSTDEVREVIGRAGLPDDAREHALGVYAILAAAEARAHGVPENEIHFHEVGSMQAIAYVCAACLAYVRLSVVEAAASEVCTGFGFVDCAHGRLPIPAPATANVLEGVPSFAGTVEGELTTPTGAALVRHFARSFGDMPPMAVEAVGLGVGRDGLDSKSTLRAVIGKGA